MLEQLQIGTGFSSANNVVRNGMVQTAWTHNQPLLSCVDTSAMFYPEMSIGEHIFASPVVSVQGSDCIPLVKWNAKV